MLKLKTRPAAWVAMAQGRQHSTRRLQLTCGAHSCVSSAVGGTGSTWPSASWVTQSEKGLPVGRQEGARASCLGACSGGAMGCVAWCSSRQVLSRHRLPAFATVVGRCCAPAAHATASPAAPRQAPPQPQLPSPAPPRTGLEHAVLLAGVGDQGRPARVGLQRVHMAHHNQGGAAPGSKVGGTELSLTPRAGASGRGVQCPQSKAGRPRPREGQKRGRRVFDQQWMEGAHANDS